MLAILEMGLLMLGILHNFIDLFFYMAIFLKIEVNVLLSV